MSALKPLETRYDVSGEGPLTVATPSCCCCCCCLGTATGVITFSARQVSNEQNLHKGHWLGALIAALAFPLAIGAMIAFYNVAPSSDVGDVLLWAVGFCVAVGVYAAGHHIAGSPNTAKAFAVPTKLLIVAAVAVVVEFFAVLFTLAIGELAIVPLLVWLAVKAADSVSPRAKNDSIDLAPYIPAVGFGGPGPPMPGAQVQQQPPPHAPPAPPSALQTPPAVPQAPPQLRNDQLPPDFPGST
jgi:hypothetical protein